jgi:hypothetical protein
MSWRIAGSIGVVIWTVRNIYVHAWSEALGWVDLDGRADAPVVPGHAEGVNPEPRGEEDSSRDSGFAPAAAPRNDVVAKSSRVLHRHSSDRIAGPGRACPRAVSAGHLNDNR